MSISITRRSSAVAAIAALAIAVAGSAPVVSSAHVGAHVSAVITQTHV